jgi:hypothetical protein
MVRKPEGNTLLGKSRCRYVDNIKTELIEIRCGDIDSIILSG